MTSQDDAELSALGYTAHFDRNMSLWENFALGFTYLSPVVGVYSVFGIGMAAGGPAMIWWYPIAALGQFIVCLTFCEVVSQFPISGGLYPWCRRLVGRKWAWMAGWIYGWALFTSIAAVAAGAAPFVAPLLGFQSSPVLAGLIAIALVALSTLTNLAGTRMLARVAMFGFICEILGALAVGTFLLLFHRHQPLGILFSSFGIARDGHYGPAFLSAAIVGLFTCYGFEACGDVAEETPNPGIAIPRAMKSTIYIGMSASIFVCLALILSLPDVMAVVEGRVANPIEDALLAAFGPLGAKLVMLVVLVSFLSCILSLQAAASRLVYAYARDDMVVASGWLARVSERHHVPTNALVLSGVVAGAILVLGMFFADTVATIVSFAVVGIYAGFQMVVLGALVARSRGWRPRGRFRLGAWAWPVNVAGLAWGVWAIADMLRPADGAGPWYMSWAMALTFGAVVLTGLAYMLAARP
ncbi:MAG TPA: amino acid permease, partial [Novosphingobium sp.]|nr:amino acid permease [Novosphingobium sp.]